MSESSNWESDTSGIWDEETQPEEEKAYMSKITHLCEWFERSDPPENEGEFEDFNTEQNTEEMVKINGELSELILFHLIVIIITLVWSTII